MSGDNKYFGGLTKIADSLGVTIDPAISDDITIKLIDDTGTVIYVGKALPGTATAAASWLILKYDYTSSPNSILYAASGLYSSIWDNRASLSYS